MGYWQRGLNTHHHLSLHEWYFIPIVSVVKSSQLWRDEIYDCSWGFHPVQPALIAGDGLLGDVQVLEGGSFVWWSQEVGVTAQHENQAQMLYLALL